MSVVKKIYWKFVAALARITRSVQALNEGFTPAGSVSTGPHQPLSALRDTVSLLGATAGRLDARLESIALTTGSATDRLVFALALGEVAKASASTPVWVTGDAVALRLATDLSALGYAVTVGDTVETAGHPLVGTIERMPVSGLSPAAGSIILVASGLPLSLLSATTASDITALLERAPEAVMISASTVGDTSSIALRPDAADVRTVTRELNPREGYVSAQPLHAATLSSQLPL